MNTRQKRLQNEFQILSELVSNSGGTLAIISTQGNPPYEYVIEYRCKVIERLQGNDPVFRTNHRVQIVLSNNYPNEKPTAKFLTPIFHPNVYENLNICLGNYWTNAETVPELVLRIGKIIQYSKDILNLGSPANLSPKSWAERNMNRFPVDTQTFKSQIVWDDISSTGSSGTVNISFSDL